MLKGPLVPWRHKDSSEPSWPQVPSGEGPSTSAPQEALPPPGPQSPLNFLQGSRVEAPGPWAPACLSAHWTPRPPSRTQSAGGQSPGLWGLITPGLPPPREEGGRKTLENTGAGVGGPPAPWAEARTVGGALLASGGRGRPAPQPRTRRATKNDLPKVRGAGTALSGPLPPRICLHPRRSRIPRQLRASRAPPRAFPRQVAHLLGAHLPQCDMAKDGRPLRQAGEWAQSLPEALPGCFLRSRSKSASSSSGSHVPSSPARAFLCGPAAREQPWRIPRAIPESVQIIETCGLRNKDPRRQAPAPAVGLLPSLREASTAPAGPRVLTPVLVPLCSLTNWPLFLEKARVKLQA